MHDVFLSYNWRDEASARMIALQSRDHVLKVFFDHWHLVPGKPLPQDLESVLATCRAAATVIGVHGIGEWQRLDAVPSSVHNPAKYASA